MAALPGERLHFDDLIDDEAQLAAALGELYPDTELHVDPYRDDDFLVESRNGSWPGG